MKRLLFLLVVFFTSIASAQSFPVKNVNDEYLVNPVHLDDNVLHNLHRIKRDNNGLYWFESVTAINSFDGVNWKSHRVQIPNGNKIIVRINDMEVTDDGRIWLATEGGIFEVESASDNLLLKKQAFSIKELPVTINCIYKGLNNLVLVSILKEGFYVFDGKSRVLKHIIIDSSARSGIPIGISPVTPDNKGNFWGITNDNKGIWCYNTISGKISRSWKGELFPSAAKRFQNGISDITYSEKDNVLWISYGSKGILEKMYVSSGLSRFYSFTGNLQVQADSNAKNRLPLIAVKIDRDGNEWISVGGKYLVKIHDDIHNFEYLVNDPDLLPMGEQFRFFPERVANSSAKLNNNLLWVTSKDGLAVIKKKNSVVHQFPFDTISLSAGDYENPNGRMNMFLEEGRNHYYLLQPDPGRPKLICLDRDFHISHTLFNDEWKKYPAYFNRDFDEDNFYVALMRPGVEPLDFRSVVIKDFRVDLRSFKTEAIKLNFNERIWRYGARDAANNYWLYSAGYLYSYNPENNILDSIYICKPAAKGPYNLKLVKGFDYPTVLHKSSSSFWIDFPAARELYKINLKTKKIDTVFKCCFGGKECTIPSGIYNMYVFDSARIYLQLAFSPLLINVRNNTVTEYPDLFKHKLPAEGQVGSGIFNNWICNVTPTEVNVRNAVTGTHKKLALNDDFKWRLSPLKSKPLVNNKGEMILMSSAQKKFIVFNLDSLPAPEKPGIVHLSVIKMNNRNLLLDSLMKLGTLSLKFNGYQSIFMRFSENSIHDQNRITYEYALYNGGDTAWNRVEGEPELTLSRMSSGKYQLLLRAANDYGDFSEKVTSFPIVIIPPFWQTWWFRALALLLFGLIFFGLYRYRLQQMARLQKIRNNIAIDLHDDIGSTLNSISIYSEVARQQAGKELPALEQIGLNSRKIIESMSDIVWTINPENDSFEKIIIRMRSFAYQLLKAKNIEFSFEADEKLNTVALSMQVRKNFYLVFKEAITNLVKYSGASRVLITLYEVNKNIVLNIRDDGIGIPVNAESQGNGLGNMKRRADEIHADLHIHSANGEGTGIELTLKKQT